MSLRSIRSRLTLWYFAVLLAGLILFATGVWLYLAFLLRADKRATLEHRVERFSAFIDAHTGEPVREALHVYDGIRDGVPEGNLVQVFDEHGARLVPEDAAVPTLPWPMLKPGERYGQMKLHGIRYQSIERHLLVEGMPLRIQIASQEEENLALLARLRLALATLVPLVLLVSYWGGYVLSGRALRPVARLASAAEQMGERDLHSRLPLPGTEDEMERLAEVFNGLLERLERALLRQRAFTADASHDLRTPLATARVTAEIALRAEPGPDARQALESLLDDLGDMEKILTDMLLLARTEGNVTRRPPELAAALPLFAEVCERMQPSALEHGVTLRTDLSLAPSALVAVDASAVRRVLAALIENSIRYTKAGGSICVLAYTAQGEVVCVVRDTGIGIAADALPHIFDRFFRADPARALETGGSGLGLAIARETIDRLGGWIGAHSRLGEGTTITFALPLQREARGVA